MHWHLLRPEHTQHIRSLIAAATTWRKDVDSELWSTVYRNKHVVALRQVLDRAWLLGLMTADECDRAQRVSQFAGTRLPKGEHLPDERVSALFAACDADLDPDDVEDDVLWPGAGPARGRRMRDVVPARLPPLWSCCRGLARNSCSMIWWA
ncbi:hypothetical protein [Nonomuraea jabiensis]|uniref:hypothetical protein n=1 Tax=Nonomuraea jabiensis TaxID=882448 RepID=UPI003680FCF4